MLQYPPNYIIFLCYENPFLFINCHNLTFRENYLFLCDCPKCRLQCDDPDVTSSEEEEDDDVRAEEQNHQMDVNGDAR